MAGSRPGSLAREACGPSGPHPHPPGEPHIGWIARTCRTTDASEVSATAPLGAADRIRVLVVDDNDGFRESLVFLLSGEDLEVIGQARSGPEAIEMVRRLTPDVVLMDVRMPGTDGIEATRVVTAGVDPPRVLVLTTFDLDEIVYDALRAGASAFLLKDAPEERLTAAIRVVSDGGSLFAPSVTRRLIEEFARRSPEATVDLDGLTDRETEVLRLVARGMSNQEIAAHLFVTENTVKTHVARLLMKLGVRDRVQAVVAAYESGLVRPAAGA